MHKHYVWMELWPESKLVSFTLRDEANVCKKKSHTENMEDWALYNWFEKTKQGKKPHWKARKILEDGETAMCDLAVNGWSYEAALMEVGRLKFVYESAGWRVKYQGPRNYRKSKENPRGT